MSRRTFSYDLQLVFDRPDRRCAGTGRRYLPMPCYPEVGYGQVVGRGTARALVVSDGRWPHILTPGSSSSSVTRASPISVAPNSMLPAGQDAAEAFYRVVDAAHERRSVAVTSNLYPSGFDTIMPWQQPSSTGSCTTHTTQAPVKRRRISLDGPGRCWEPGVLGGGRSRGGSGGMRRRVSTWQPVTWTRSTTRRSSFWGWSKSRCGVRSR